MRYSRNDFPISIDAFHADPATGHIDPADRLVPGIHEANRSGQQGYVHAFEDATMAEGLATADLGFRVSFHLLRKSLATDLTWQEGIEDTVRRQFMGHRAGDDVFGRIYTLDHPEIAPLVKVAASRPSLPSSPSSEKRTMIARARLLQRPPSSLPRSAGDTSDRVVAPC